MAGEDRVGPRNLVQRREPVSYARGRTAELLDPLDQFERALLELGGQRLDEVRATEWIGRIRAAGLLREDLLRSQRDPRRALRRQRERLVETVRVQRLRAAAHRRE